MRKRLEFVLNRSEFADKNIVDRRKTRRNRDVMATVRKTRDLLAEQSGGDVYSRELLKMHAHTTVASASAIPILVLLVTIGGYFAGIGGPILIWAVISVSLYAVLAYVARSVDKKETHDILPEIVRRNLMVAHVASGFGWAYFATLSCDACAIEQFPVAKALVLLLAIAATAMITAGLRNALIATFLLPVAAFSLLGADAAKPVEFMMIAVLIAALPFFGTVTSHLNTATTQMLSFRREKDGLIAELETAKSMSDEARRRAEEANLAKSRFLASMSHELRTPLNAILGFSEVMASEVLGPMQNPTYKDYARDIHESGSHLLELINEILDLSRIEAGRYTLNEEPVALSDILDDCCHMIELRARNKSIRIVQQFEPDLPRLYADERAVRQIALNLLSNAVKFTPTNGEIRVRAGWTAGGGQYLAIKDNGPGIPADEIPVVLSAFGQGSIAIKSAEQGTGLGLPIVQALIEMHGGKFDFQSKLREGTEATAIFPPQRVMEALPAVPAAARG